MYDINEITKKITWSSGASQYCKRGFRLPSFRGKRTVNAVRRPGSIFPKFCKLKKKKSVKKLEWIYL